MTQGNVNYFICCCVSPRAYEYNAKLRDIVYGQGHGMLNVNYILLNNLPVILASFLNVITTGKSLLI